MLKEITFTPFQKLDFSSSVVLLGTTYHSLSPLHSTYSNLIYFSYRKNLVDGIHADCNRVYFQDTNWGCAIRSGQMLFARVLQCLVAESSTSRSEIISLFIDEKCRPLSIQNICEAGKAFKCEPGKFWRPSSVLLSIGKLACLKIVDSSNGQSVVGTSQISEDERY